MPLAASGEAAVLTALLTGAYVSLHTADSSAGANEVATGSYTRKPGTFTQTGSNPTTAANNATIEFPTATGDWGSITYIGVWDASTGGNLLAYGALDVPKNVLTGDVFRFLTGQCSVAAD